MSSDTPLIDSLRVAVRSYDELTPGLMAVLRGRLKEAIPSDNRKRTIERYTYRRADDNILITYEDTIERIDVYIDEEGIYGNEIKK